MNVTFPTNSTPFKLFNTTDLSHSRAWVMLLSANNFGFSRSFPSFPLPSVFLSFTSAHATQSAPAPSPLTVLVMLSAKQGHIQITPTSLAPQQKRQKRPESIMKWRSSLKAMWLIILLTYSGFINNMF